MRFAGCASGARPPFSRLLMLHAPPYNLRKWPASLRKAAPFFHPAPRQRARGSTVRPGLPPRTACSRKRKGGFPRALLYQPQAFGLHAVALYGCTGLCQAFRAQAKAETPAPAQQAFSRSGYIVKGTQAFMAAAAWACALLVEPFPSTE